MKNTCEDNVEQMCMRDQTLEEKIVDGTVVQC